MRVAIIGVNGNFGLKRLKAMQRSNDHVTALCDLQFNRALQVYQPEGVILETDYHRLLNCDLEVAVISLPDHVKLPVVADFLSAGKHVLVEKPLSLRVADVKHLFSLAEKNNVCLYVGYNLHFFPSVARLLELVRQEFFGFIHYVRMFYGHGGVQTLLTTQNWRSGQSSWGGAFVDMGTHLLSLASELVPRVDSGIFERQHVISPSVEDNCVALLKSNGCLIELASSWTAWRSGFSVQLYGSEGFAELDGLVKYIKYGQSGERIRYGRKNPSGAPSVEERVWALASPEGSGIDPVDPFSVDIEYADREWSWFTSAIASKAFDLAAEEKKNYFVADAAERFYA
jgi:predicted dehydrogenase